MKQALVKIIDLEKFFKDKGKIFDKLNLAIYPQENLALVARNGIGKTVLLEILVGLRKINGGTIQWNFSFQKSPYEAVGFLFQNDNLSKNFYVKDYINLLKKTHNIDQDFLTYLLQIFKIDEILAMQIADLSGGQKQLLKIVLTFAPQYKIIILDEFDNHLDSEIKQKVISFIKDYLQKFATTLLLVSHDFDDIKQICQKIAFLGNGKISQITKITTMNPQKFKTFLETTS